MFGYIIGFIFLLWVYYVFFYKPRQKVHIFTRPDKRVVFIEMIHVGSKEYYDEVRWTILKESWKYNATYLYERILGTPEERREAGAYIAPMPMMEMYKELAKLLNKEVQPQDSFISEAPRSVHADFSAVKLIEAFKQHGVSKHEINEKAIENLRTASPIARKIIRSFFNNILKLMALTKANRWFKRNKQKDAVAVVMRDEHLYKTVMETPGNIVITYGAGHYPGFKRLMGKGWKVKSYKMVPC